MRWRSCARAAARSWLPQVSSEQTLAQVSMHECALRSVKRAARAHAVMQSSPQGAPGALAELRQSSGQQLTAAGARCSGLSTALAYWTSLAQEIFHC